MKLTIYFIDGTKFEYVGKYDQFIVDAISSGSVVVNGRLHTRAGRVIIEMY